MTQESGTRVSRILGVVFGVLIILVGVYSMLTPIQTFGVVGWLIVAALITDGVGKVLIWNDSRRLGLRDTWALVGGIASVILGIAVACSQLAMAAVDLFVAYLVGAWVLLGGCMRIARSFAMRDVYRATGGRLLGSNWDLALILGILMVLLGVFCLANPVFVMVALGWQVGFALIIGGVGLITATL